MSEKREIRCAIELRADASRESPGRLVGTLLEYNERASDRAELFEQGSLSWPESGIILNRQHQRGSPIMRVVPIVQGNSVVLDSALPDTQAGRDTAAEIRAGLFNGLSVEFKAIKQRFEGGVRKIGAAMLQAAAIVDSPAYSGSAGLEVRGKGRRRKRLWR